MSLFKKLFHSPQRVLALEGDDLNAAISIQCGSVEAVNYAENIGSLISLALPEPTDRCEDWIHLERGPQKRWIVRLMRFYRAEPKHPWASREQYVADADEQTIALGTAYGRAWLYSHTSWPAADERDHRIAS
jgi:hypothetical protein